jgi:hypothetical protein
MREDKKQDTPIPYVDRPCEISDALGMSTPLARDERVGSRQQLRIDGNNDRAQRHECGTDGRIEQDPPGVGDAGRQRNMARGL